MRLGFSFARTFTRRDLKRVRGTERSFVAKENRVTKLGEVQAVAWTIGPKLSTGFEGQEPHSLAIEGPANPELERI